MVKNLPAMRETWRREDPLEEGMATHCSIVAWRIPWSRSLVGCIHRVIQSRIQLKRLSMDVTDFFLFFSGRGAHPRFSSVASHSS